MRENYSKVGPTDTRNNYADTSAQRNNQRQKTFSVNIPFAKYATPSKPNSANAGFVGHFSEQKLNA